MSQEQRIRLFFEPGVSGERYQILDQPFLLSGLAKYCGSFKNLPASIHGGRASSIRSFAFTENSFSPYQIIFNWILKSQSLSLSQSEHVVAPIASQSKSYLTLARLRNTAKHLEIPYLVKAFLKQMEHCAINDPLISKHDMDELLTSGEFSVSSKTVMVLADALVERYFKAGKEGNEKHRQEIEDLIVQYPECLELFRNEVKSRTVEEQIGDMNIADGFEPMKPWTGANVHSRMNSVDEVHPYDSVSMISSTQERKATSVVQGFQQEKPALPASYVRTRPIHRSPNTLDTETSSLSHQEVIERSRANVPTTTDNTASSSLSYQEMIERSRANVSVTASSNPSSKSLSHQEMIEKSRANVFCTSSSDNTSKSRMFGSGSDASFDTELPAYKSTVSSAPSYKTKIGELPTYKSTTSTATNHTSTTSTSPKSASAINEAQKDIPGTGPAPAHASSTSIPSDYSSKKATNPTYRSSTTSTASAYRPRKSSTQSHKSAFNPASPNYRSGSSTTHSSTFNTTPRYRSTYSTMSEYASTASETSSPPASTSSHQSPCPREYSRGVLSRVNADEYRQAPQKTKRYLRAVDENAPVQIFTYDIPGQEPSARKRRQRADMAWMEPVGPAPGKRDRRPGSNCSVM